MLSWAFYDWANSAFATTVIAGFFPLFFAAYWADPTNPTLSTFWLGAANSLEAIIVAIMAPFLGAIADRMAGKKKMLVFFTFLGVLMTAGLYLIAQGHWQLAVVLYVLGNIGFSGSLIFYDALLPGVASEKKVDYVSSLGYALGYIGGGLLFVVNVLMYVKFDLFGLPDESTAIKVAFLSVALWWAFFSIPILLFVKEPPVKEQIGIRQAVASGLQQLKDTFQKVKKLKYVALFLVGYWFYIDGVDTIIRMAVDYGTKLGFDSTDLIIALLIVQFVAFPGTLLYHKLSAKIGVQKAILVAIGAYSAFTLLGAFMTQVWHFFALAVLIGCFQGGIQALSRSLYSRLIPADQTGEFYGFYNMIGKFSAVVGPILMGYITLVTGNIRFGIISILILFIVGGALLAKVDIQKGEEMATAWHETGELPKK